MQVTTTATAGARFVLLQTDDADLSILMEPGETAADTLSRRASEHRLEATRLLARARRCEAGVDSLLLTEGAAS